MGSQLHPNWYGLIADIQRDVPAAQVSIDATSDPCMVTVIVGVCKSRGFIERHEIEQRGEMYGRWLRAMLAQIEQSLEQHKPYKNEL